jgi:hypothetical protein
MDRRSFNKTLAGIAATLTLPFKAAPVEAATLPFVPGASLLLPPPPVAGHYGFTNLNLTTTFELEQVFGQGDLHLLARSAPDPDVEMCFSFYLDPEKKIERTVYFEGNKKAWEILAEEDKSGLLERVEMLDDWREGERGQSRYRQYYGVTEIRIYEPNSLQRVSVDKIKKDELYTIHVYVSEDSNEVVPVKRDRLDGYPPEASTRVILTDFKVTDIEDYNDDNDIISQGITK